MFIKPAPGLRIRDPHTKQFLPDDGVEVPNDDLFWHRLINDGDVILVPPDQPAIRSRPSRSKE